MTEFWEEAFKSKQYEWGSVPTHTALVSAEIFARYRLKKTLIPDIG